MQGTLQIALTAQDLDRFCRDSAVVAQRILEEATE